jgi:hypothetical protein
MREVLSIAGKAFAETVHEARRQGPDAGPERKAGDDAAGQEEERRAAAAGGVAARPGVGGLDFGVVRPPLPDAPALDPVEAFRGYEGVTASTHGTHVGIEHGVVEYVNLGWLGILFQDRLRFRPAGLVPGDQVFSLSLAPGEEATLTQRSETKKSRSFEEIVDQEVERQLEFSSTWTTDFTQADASTESSTTSGNLGVGVGIPIEGVNVNINAAVSGSEANSTSQNIQRARNLEITSRITAKAREQHKTTFKVGTDVTEELGSKRVLRNANPSRALTLNVYKLYQKYRIILERWDAKLCLSLGLYDPGRDLREELEEELAKLDPHVPAGACPDMPVGGAITSAKSIDNLNATEVGGDEYGFEMFSTVLPPGTVLSDWTFEITSWTVNDGSGMQYQADPTEFYNFGGKWWFRSDADVPVIGAAGAQSNVVNVLMPEAWGPGWWTVRVTGTMTWYTVPSEAITTEVRTCIDEEKQKILASFSAERVMQILEEVSASRRELVFKRLFEEVLMPGYFAQGINPPLDVLERVRNYFDWNEAVVEYVPWWMTATGRERRDLLRERLLKLPGDTRSDLIIDDSRARGPVGGRGAGAEAAGRQPGRGREGQLPAAGARRQAGPGQPVRRRGGRAGRRLPEHAPGRAGAGDRLDRAVHAADGARLRHAGARAGAAQLPLRHRPRHLAIETLLPALARSAAALRGYGGQRLRRALLDRPSRRLAFPEDVPDDPAITRVLDAFGGWSTWLAEELRQSHSRLLVVAGDQSGGRVRTPALGQLAPGGRWSFTLNEPKKDGSTEQVDHTAEELIGYEVSAGGGSKRDAPADAEVFWMLRSVWDRVGTAVALVNQAGMRFWFNAANNRWGGAHPPHRVHRQGCSFDFDVGYGWREGHKVPNVKQRDAAGRALSEDVVPKNKQNADCLHRVDRLAGWIATQAWLLVGVSQYLYGDAALVTEAYRHLEARLGEDKQSIVKPARLDPVIDAKQHNDHWHFEVLPGPAPGQIDPYSFQVDDAGLLDRLRAWAVARDGDPVFWHKFAGLDATPTKLDDFKGLPDADDWKRWWSRGHAPADEETHPPSDAGIPLLPIWAPSEAPDTFEVNGCFDPREDNPSIFAPGQIEV